MIDVYKLFSYLFIDDAQRAEPTVDYKQNNMNCLMTILAQQAEDAY